MSEFERDLAFVSGESGLDRMLLEGNIANRTTGFAENFDSAFDATLRGSTLIGFDRQRSQLMWEAFEEMRRVAPQEAVDPLRLDVGQTEADRDALFFERAADLNKRFNLNLPTGPEDLDQRVARNTRVSEERFARTSEFADTAGVAGGFAGGVGAIAIDAPTLLSLPLGAGAGTGLFRAMVANAGINVAAEVPTQAVVQTERSKLGLDAGLDRALTNIGLAAAGGAAFTAVFRGVGKTVDVVRGRLGNRLTSKEKAVLDIHQRLSETEEVLTPVARTPAQRDAALRTLSDAVEALRKDQPLPAAARRPAGPPQSTAAVHTPVRVKAENAPAQVANPGAAVRTVNNIAKAGEELRATVARNIESDLQAETIAQNMGELLNSPRIDEVLGLIARRIPLEEARAAALDLPPRRREAALRALRQQFDEVHPNAEPGAFDTFVRGRDPVQRASQALEDAGVDVSRPDPQALREQLSARSQPDGRHMLNQNRGPTVRAAQELSQPENVARAQQVVQSEEAELARLLETGEDADIRVEFTDGRSMKVSEIIEEVRRDEAAVQAAKLCAGLGG